MVDERHLFAGDGTSAEYAWITYGQSMSFWDLAPYKMRSISDAKKLGDGFSTGVQDVVVTVVGTDGFCGGS